jgi:hypothetical protein
MLDSPREFENLKDQRQRYDLNAAAIFLQAIDLAIDSHHVMTFGFVGHNVISAVVDLNGFGRGGHLRSRSDVRLSHRANEKESR